MPEAPSPRVLLATWDWRSAADPVAGDSGQHLRRGAVIQAVVMGLVGAFLAFGLHHELFARIVWVLAGVVLFLGLVFPRAYRPIHGFGRRLGRLVGTGLTYLLLVPFFFLFFTPVALILRLQRRDPLRRGFRDSQWTYWIARPAKQRTDNIDKLFLREDRQARDTLRPVHPGNDPEEPDRP